MKLVVVASVERLTVGVNVAGRAQNLVRELHTEGTLG
jgi:hypothetical protein